MPLIHGYGVAVGEFTSYATNQGQWFHVDMNINARGAVYQAAVDVNEQNSAFQYQIFNNLDQSLFEPVLGFADGWHLLAANSTSGAIDYARSPILEQRFGCLALFFAFLNLFTGGKSQTWNNVTGNEAGEALIAMVTGSRKVYAFGEPYTSGLGVHNVHCNQGDPPGTHQADDGIWQDGCVFALKADGTLSAYLGKFATQSLNTDSNGLPK